MNEATPNDIHRLVDDLDRGRQAWISGQLEETATTVMAQADDMTIFGPFGGELGRGGPEGVARQRAVAARFGGGSGRCELVKAMASGEMLVLVMIERNTVTFMGDSAPRPWVLRTTQVFRRDGDRWIRLRHADPLIRPRSFADTFALIDHT